MKLVLLLVPNLCHYKLMTYLLLANYLLHLINRLMHLHHHLIQLTVQNDHLLMVWVGKQVVVKAMFPNTNIPDQGKVNRREVLRSLRDIVEPQIREYRRRFAGKSVIKSSLTGRPIFGPYHVDHVYPFIWLVEEWCRENALDLETIAVRCRGAVCRLESIDLAESWFDYHALHAEFQVLDASENTSKGSRYFGRIAEQPIEDP